MKLPKPCSLGELGSIAQKKIQLVLDGLGSGNLSVPVEVVGDPDTMISSVSPIEALEKGCISFAVSSSIKKKIEASPAAALILSPNLKSDKPYLKTDLPKLVFSSLLEIIQEEPSGIQGEEANIRYKDKSSLTLGGDVRIGDFCYIGKNVGIGTGSRIYPNVFIDDDVEIGEGCIIYPRVSLFRNTKMGNNVIIHSGAVIGDDGFGFVQLPDMEQGRLYHLKSEHIGGVEIGDNVEIGSQVCVDRGMAANTEIGSGTKIDNLTQVGHNVRIGRDCIVVKAAFAGSARIGDRAFLMGANVRDGISIGDDALILGGADVYSDLPSGSNQWAGSPAQPAQAEWKNRISAQRDIPRLRQFFKAFKNAESFDDLKRMFFKK